jgi:hypothetical protein
MRLRAPAAARSHNRRALARAGANLDQRPPNEPVHGNDHDAHRNDGGDLSGYVASRYRQAHVGAKAWKLEILVSERKGLVDREKKPAASHGHHAIVNQPLRRKRQLDPQEALPRPEAAKGAHLSQVFRNSFKRIIIAKHHVPDLGGENHEHA